MLRLIFAAAGIACTFIGASYTKPVVAGSAMAETLTQTSPGTYLVNVKLASLRPTEEGTMVKVADSDIIVECRGPKADKALVKYDGFKTSCRFRA